MAWMPGFLMLLAGDSQPFPGDVPVQKLINTVSFSLGKTHVQGTDTQISACNWRGLPAQDAGTWTLVMESGGGGVCGCLACTDAMSPLFPAGGLRLHFNHSLYQRGVGDADHLAWTVWPSEKTKQQNPSPTKPWKKPICESPNMLSSWCSGQELCDLGQVFSFLCRELNILICEMKGGWDTEVELRFLPALMCLESVMVSHG